LLALSLIESVPARGPTADGVNITLITHLCFAGNELPHVLASE
jgi:hypothetical protein